MKRAVRSRRKVCGQLLKHARRHPHRECCGILAGQDGVITQAFPAKNAAADPIRNYEISPKEIALAYYSEATYFIVTPRPYATAPIRAFSIRHGRATELEIQVLP